MAAGIQPWRLILDPGLGFAKGAEGNVALMAGLRRIRAALAPPLCRLPLLLGPSRKGFLGKLTGERICLLGGVCGSRGSVARALPAFLCEAACSRS